MKADENLIMDREYHEPEVGKESKQFLTLGWSDYVWPFLFLISMSMIGLAFPLGFLLVPLILISRFRNNRYDFLIMLTIFLGGFGFTAEGSYPIKTWDIAFILSVILIVIHRNRGIVKKSVIAWFLYCLTIFVISTFSEERLDIQFRLMRYAFAFSWFIVPIVCFVNRKFEIKEFFSALMPYLIIICIFYILDGFVVCGFIFLPRTPLWGEIPDSYFFSPIVFGFPEFVRKYPQGLILIALAIYPLSKYYKLRLWQWLVFFGACAACQTFTVISGFVVGLIICVVKPKTIMKFIIGIPVAFGLLYTIDGFLPVRHNDTYDESFLRVKSSIDQFIELSEMQDDVDLADFGSGRMGQALPKLELVYMLDKQWTGLGFLHPQLTTNPKYIIDNEYYVDTSKSEEVATQLIEVEVLQVFVTTGWLGLIAYFVFFTVTFVLIRNFKYSRYYLSLLVMSFWFGIGAYGGLTVVNGLMIVSLAYGVVILAQKTIDDEK